MSDVDSLWGADSPGVAALRQGVKALAVRDGEALLVKERNNRGQPFWTLPGGGMHPGESRRTALHRELAEELRCEATIGGRTGWMIYVHTSPTRTVSAYTVYACSVGPEPTADRAHGILEWAWCPLDDLPTRTLPQVRAVLG